MTEHNENEDTFENDEVENEIHEDEISKALRENFESFFMASGLKTKVLGMVNQVLAMSTSPEQEKS